MKLLIVYGENDSGKTTSCVKLLKCLIALGGTVKSYDTFDWPDDFKSLLEFRHKRIGIYSPGDERGHLTEAIAFGKNNNCDILVATVRKGIAYNAPLQNIGANNSGEWVTLASGLNIDEKDNNENGAVIEILNKIHR